MYASQENAPTLILPGAEPGEERGEYAKRIMQVVREWRAADEYARQRRWSEGERSLGSGSSLLPTRERAQHDPVELLERPIADEDGHISRPHRAVDVLERMFRAKRLEAVSYAAACDFRTDFAQGQLQQLRAVEMGRIKGGGREPQFGAAAMEARERVGQAMTALGGRADDPTSSAAASAVWFVVGVGESVKEWARRMRWGAGRGLREEHGSTILITALGVLAGHYARQGQGMASRSDARSSRRQA